MLFAQVALNLLSALTHSQHEAARRVHETDPAPLSLTTVDAFPDAFRFEGFASHFYLRFPPFNTDVYLRLGDVVLRNDAFFYIGVTDSLRYGIHVWMTDDALDMAMETIRRDYECDAHRVAIANSTVAQICFFAFTSEDSSPEEYAEYKTQYQDKRWIFIVINDAIGGTENRGNSGTHWSFVAMDREIKRAYFYDSLYAQSANDHEKVWNVVQGMVKILEEDPIRWYFYVQWYTPNQDLHNRFPSDGGACGPFVYKMIQVLISHTIHCYRTNQDNLCFELHPAFPNWFRDTHFDSLLIREEIQYKIARQKANAEGNRLIDSHDRVALYNSDVDVVEGPMEFFDIPLSCPTVQMRDPASEAASIGTDIRSSSPAAATIATGPVIIDLTEDGDMEDEDDGNVGDFIIYDDNPDKQDEAEDEGNDVVPIISNDEPDKQDEDEAIVGVSFIYEDNPDKQDKSSDPPRCLAIPYEELD